MQNELADEVSQSSSAMGFRQCPSTLFRHRQGPRKELYAADLHRCLMMRKPPC